MKNKILKITLSAVISAALMLSILSGCTKNNKNKSAGSINSKADKVYSESKTATSYSSQSMVSTETSASKSNVTGGNSSKIKNASQQELQQKSNIGKSSSVDNIASKPKTESNDKTLNSTESGDIGNIQSGTIIGDY